MNCKPPSLRRPKPGAQPQCVKCRLLQRRRLPLKRQGRQAVPGERHDRQAIASALYAGVLLSWEALPERKRHALNIDLAAIDKGDEAALGDLARLLLDCANALFKQALTGRQQRLAEPDALAQDLIPAGQA